MNIYGQVILVTLLISYFLDLMAEILNLKSLEEKIPEEFKDIFDAEDYKKSQQYTRAKTRLGLVSSFVGLSALLVFWFVGGFDILDRWLRSWEFDFLLTGLLYIGVLAIAQMLLSLPFSIYSTFVIEERFGFNKTTPATFVMDLAKGLLLSVILGGPLLALVLMLLQSYGVSSWWMIWLVVTVFMVAVQFVAPTWIMPLFNKFTPLEEGELKEAIMKLADTIHFPLQGIYVIDGSKRSTKANAFFTGFGKNKRIALFDTLIASHSVSELVAVLAHEIGHYKKKHIHQGMLIGIFQTGLMLYLLSVFISHQGLFEAFYIQQPSVYTGLILFGLLYSPMSTLVSIGLQMLSRKNEFEADHFATKSIADCEDMVSALKKLSVDSLSNLTPHPFYVFIHYSHPPVLKRIEAIRNV